MQPLSLAVLDVGSNAIRYAAAEVTGPGEFRILESERLAVRLGTDAFTAGALSDRTVDTAVGALRLLRLRMDGLGIAHYRAVATSAARESGNADALVQRVWREAGLRLEVISGEEEARLGWRAMRSRLPDPDAPWLIADLGGGSLEVSRVQGDQVHWSRSEPLGAVRLLADPALQGAAPDAVRQRMRSLRDEIQRRLQGETAVSGLAATGGNLEALANLAGLARGDSARVLTLDALREVMERLAGLTVEQRVEQLGLTADRADVILPGAVIYEQVAEAAGVDRLHVPDAGVKEGVLLELSDRMRDRGDGPTRLAFVSDVHANVLGLRAALQRAAEAGAVRVFFAGDAVGDGPHPVEVARMLQRNVDASIRGNVDRKVLRTAGKKKKKLRKRLEEAPRSRQNRLWSALQLRKSAEKEWLDALPQDHRLEEGGARILVVHGSPRADDDRVFSSLTPEGLASKLEPLGQWRPDLLVCGHTHAPFVAEVDGVVVANCGSAGRPADGDPRGSLLLAELRPGEPPRAEVLRFEYPVDALVVDLQERGTPGIDPEEYRLGIKS